MTWTVPCNNMPPLAKIVLWKMKPNMRKYTVRTTVTAWIPACVWHLICKSCVTSTVHHMYTEMGNTSLMSPLRCLAFTRGRVVYEHICTQSDKENSSRLFWLRHVFCLFYVDYDSAITTRCVQAMMGKPLKTSRFNAGLPLSWLGHAERSNMRKHTAKQSRAFHGTVLQNLLL